MIEEMLEGKTRLHSYNAILKKSRADQAAIALEAFELAADPWDFDKRYPQQNNFWFRQALFTLGSQLLRRKLNWTSEQLNRLVTLATDLKMPTTGVVRSLELFEREGDGRQELPPAIEDLVRALRQTNYPTQSTWRLVERLEVILERRRATDGRRSLQSLVHGQDLWSATLLEAITPSKSFDPWRNLIEHCTKARSASPSKRWQRRSTELVSAIGTVSFGDTVGRTLSAVGLENPSSAHALDATLLDDRDTDLLRGLIWSTLLSPGDDIIPVLGQTADLCFCKIRDHGPRNIKIGNACLTALSLRDELNAVGELSRLRARAKHPSTRQQLDKALERAAERLGMDRDDLEELAVPSFGLQEVGRQRHLVDVFTAEILVEAGGDVVLRWILGNGKVQKSVPKIVRENHAEPLKTLRKSIRDIRKARQALIARLEQLYLRPRVWAISDWHERYAEHPLMGTLARRLIWRAGNTDGSDQTLIFFSDGRWRGEDGQQVDLEATRQVALWHPIESPPEIVHRWRQILHQHGVIQPFKQTHREIYILTDAERQTGTYTNRFAAHILRQHQFAAIAQARGWQYHLMGAFDSHNSPTLKLPQLDLRVELWLETGEDEGTTEMGIYHCVATDCVRFVRPSGEALPLESLPELTFSEVMRDVDLFVGVTSIGNDPNWIDHTDAPHRAYWQDYAFGELGTMAQNRRQVLERVVQRLKIAKKCSFSERFLIVQGQLRTYKIHLGSGNILMSPNDAYLCIVTGVVPRRSSAQLILPFEGDSVARTILSKAFLLADDHKIKDPSITSQFRS